MKNTLVSIGLAALSLATGACTGFQSSRQVLSPTAPTALPDGSSSGSLTGVWAAGTDPAVPSPSTCKNFQWIITSQSPTAIAGSFTAECGGGVTISATATGTLTNPTTAVIHVTGNGVIGSVGCQFDLNGNGTIIDNNAITIAYTGTTCFGPVSGTKTLRRPAPAAPAPAPAPDPAPAAPSGSAFHVGPGPLSTQRAQQVVEATGREFPQLLAAYGSGGEKAAATDELLQRVIWHLQLAGYQAGRQRNPSGAVSLDKLTIFLDGQWRAFDIFTDWDIPGRETRILFIEVFPASYIASSGLPD
jgi:hypothetical protein